MNETAKRLPTPRSRGLPVSVEFQLTVYYRKFNYLDGISRLVAFGGNVATPHRATVPYPRIDQATLCLVKTILMPVLMEDEP